MRRGTPVAVTAVVIPGRAAWADPGASRSAASGGGTNPTFSATKTAPALADAVYWLQHRLFAAAVVVSLPVLVGFLGLQRFLVRGPSAGAAA
jgi:ABC-type glycerol-3-phosphate transport system permease component